MSGYTPVFRSVFEGSLCGQYPDTAAWLYILALADKNGEVDKTPQYIAAVTGMPVDDLVTCIRRFMEPDPASRSPDDDGRRLVPIDPNRSWGWRIVNHAKYREKARKAAYDSDRTASGADAARKAAQRAMSRDVPTSPDESRAVPLSDSDTDTYSEGAKAPTVRASRRCPEGFTPDREYAIKEIPDLDYDREVQKFKDWEFKTARKDWPACWRTWIGNARDRKQYAKLGVGGIQWQ